MLPILRLYDGSEKTMYISDDLIPDSIYRWTQTSAFEDTATITAVFFGSNNAQVTSLSLQIYGVEN